MSGVPMRPAPPRPFGSNAEFERWAMRHLRAKTDLAIQLIDLHLPVTATDTVETCVEDIRAALARLRAAGIRKDDR